MWILAIISKEANNTTSKQKKEGVGRIALGCHPQFFLFPSCKKRWQIKFISAKEKYRDNVSLKGVQGLKGMSHEHKSLTTTILRKA